MKETFILYLLLICNTVSGQTFSTSLIEPISNDNGWNVFEVEDGYLVLSKSSINNSFQGSLIFFKTDFEGNLQWNKFHDSLSMSSIDILKEDDFILINGFNRKDTLNPARLMKFDLNGNLTLQKTFTENLEGELAQKITKNNGTYVLFHTVYIDGIRHGWHQFLDEDFNLQEEVFYPENEYHDLVSGSDMISTADNQFLGASIKYLGFNEGYYPVLTKFTKTGEIIWSKDLNINSQYVLLNIVELSNNNLVLGWYTDTIPSNLPAYPFHPPAVYGLDSEGNIIWNYEFELSAELNESIELSELHSLSNGDFMGMGYIRYNFLTSDELDDCGWMFRMTAEGELLWQRRICQALRPLPNKYFFNGTELQNGDLLFSGSIIDPKDTGNGLDPNIWLVRVDTNGCLEPDCGEIQIITSVKNPISEKSEGDTFVVFPNPVKDKLNFKWGGDHILNKGIKIEIYDALGAIAQYAEFPNILPKEIITIRLPNLSKGIYFYKISNSFKTLKSGQIIKK